MTAAFTSAVNGVEHGVVLSRSRASGRGSERPSFGARDNSSGREVSPDLRGQVLLPVLFPDTGRGYQRLAERTELQNAKRYVGGASFGPEAVKAMGEAFDSAWNEIAGNFGEDHVETVRSKLANALLSVASEDSRNVHLLKRAALQRFALDYWRI